METSDLVRDSRFKALHRSFTVDRQAVDEETRTAHLAFSSEEEYERWFGIEVLDHDPASIRLGRLKDGAAVLVNHNTDDHVGVVEDVSVDTDRRGRAVVRFGESARAQEIFRDIVTGIRRHVSVGYIVHEMVLEEERKGAPSIYRVTDWEPFEISIVPVPADATVGVGRSLETEITEESPMSDTPKVETPQVDVKAIENRAREAEQARIRELTELGERYGKQELARKFVNTNESPENLRAAILESMGEIKRVNDDPRIGLTDREAKRFSFIRAINAKADPGNLRLQQEAGFELECSRAVEDKLHRKAQGVFIPDEVASRDFIAGPGDTGQYIVGTDHMAGSFIELLRNKMLVKAMGATELTGLVGDVAVPSMTAGHTAYWVAESGAPTESKPTMGQLAMNPKTIGAYNDISRKLLLQATPDAEMLVRNDIATVLALGIDLAALHGSGSANQPTGIINWSGIGDVAGGTNGATPTYAHMVALEEDVAVANAEVGMMGYLTNPKVRSKLKQAFEVNATYGTLPVWQPGQNGMGTVNGYKAGCTNQVSSTLAKAGSSATGAHSAIFFGNWADLIIAYWAGLDLVVDPYTGSSTGTVRVVGLQDIDIGIRHAGSFSCMKDATTT